MKYIINRILNMVLLSFMASVGWLILAMLYFKGDELIKALQIVGIIFLMLLLIFGIWVFIDKDINLIEKHCS